MSAFQQRTKNYSFMSVPNAVLIILPPTAKPEQEPLGNVAPIAAKHGHPLDSPSIRAGQTKKATLEDGGLGLKKGGSPIYQAASDTYNLLKESTLL